MGGAEQHLGIALAFGDNDVTLFPGPGKSDIDAAKIELLAGAVRNDHQAVLAQNPKQVVFRASLIMQEKRPFRSRAQSGIFLKIPQSGHVKIEAFLKGHDHLVPLAQQ